MKQGGKGIERNKQKKKKDKENKVEKLIPREK